MKKLIATALLAGAVSPGVFAADAAVAMDLAKKANCLACHSTDKKLVGPAFRDVGAKYKGDAGAEDKLISKVKKGGAGVWGAIPMPPNPAVKDEDLRTIIKYVLTLG